MIANVQHISRFRVQEILNSKLIDKFIYNYAFITICGSQDEHVDFTDLKKRGIQVLSLKFDDIDGSEKFTENRFTLERLMTEDDAVSIVKFIKELHESEKSYDLVVNCEAGLSRSAGVAHFVQIVCDINFEQFKKENPVSYPNSWVKWQCLRAWRKECD